MTTGVAMTAAVAVERNEIRAFLTLAEELHFGNTARRLRVSTARISQTIQVLERRVGAPLFVRTSRHVALTAIGQRLNQELRPAYAEVEAALARAASAGRGVDGVLRAGFVGAATGRMLLRAGEAFAARYPGCDIDAREVQMGDAYARLRAGEIDILLACLPVSEPGLDTGPVLFSEPRMLAVPAGHPYARRASISVEDLAGVRLLQAPCSLPEYRATPDAPPRTPSGRPIAPGQRAETFQEILTLIGAARGVFPVGAQAAVYHARPDVAYVPFADAPPLRWGTVWDATAATARIRAFNETIDTMADRRPLPP